MSRPQDLRDSSPKDIDDFLESFDTVLTDCDGVLWRIPNVIEGALETLNKLQDLGKKVYFVSNNSTITVEEYLQKFKNLGFEAHDEQIVIPSRVVAWYLNNIGFQGEAYVIGTCAFRKMLTEAGIKLADSGPNSVGEDIQSILRIVKDEPTIKAVIVDFDVNLNWVKMTQAVSYLKRDDCIFVSGALDTRLPIGAKISLIGPGIFTNIIAEMARRKPIVCAKPGTVLRDYILENCKIPDPKRCIFIGDTTSQDMAFGTLCGFKKFFVSSGDTTLEETLEEEETTPDVYLPSLGHLLPLLPETTIENGKDS